MDDYSDLTNVIQQAIRDAWSKGHDDIGQTGHAVRMVRSLRPDISATEAMRLIERVRGYVSTPDIPS